MDMTDTIIPKSDQLNAEDLLSGPRTVTITKVSKGSAEQPVDVHLAEFPGRPFRPCKSMRRVMVSAWGADAAAYTGHRMTIYRDADVRFGGLATGGIRVSHLSHIDKPMTLALTVTRGKRAPFTVHPLADAPRAAEPAGDGITPQQAADLNKAMENDLDLTAREDKLAYLSGALGREIGSSKDLTRAEASRLLDEITRDLPEPTLPDGSES